MVVLALRGASHDEMGRVDWEEKGLQELGFGVKRAGMAAIMVSSHIAALIVRLIPGVKGFAGVALVRRFISR